MKKIVNFLNNNWCEIIAYSALILFFLILEGDYVTLKKQNEMKYKRDSVEYELMKVDYSFMTDTTSKQIDNVLIIFYNYILTRMLILKLYNSVNLALLK